MLLWPPSCTKIVGSWWLLWVPSAGVALRWMELLRPGSNEYLLNVQWCMGEGNPWRAIPAPKPSVKLAEDTIATALHFTSPFAQFCFPSIHSSTAVAQEQEHSFYNLLNRTSVSECVSSVHCLLQFANRMQTMEKDMSQKFSLSKRATELPSSEMG